MPLVYSLYGACQKLHTWKVAKLTHSLCSGIVVKTLRVSQLAMPHD